MYSMEFTRQQFEMKQQKKRLDEVIFTFICFLLKIFFSTLHLNVRKKKKKKNEVWMTTLSNILFSFHSVVIIHSGPIKVKD